jgi:hypothetical protein
MTLAPFFNFSMISCSYSLSTMASSNNPPKYHSAVAFQKFNGEDGAERARALTTMYVVQLAALPHCIDPRRRSTSCDCLHQQLRSTIWMPHIVSGILDHHLQLRAQAKENAVEFMSMLQHARRTAPS